MRRDGLVPERVFLSGSSRAHRLASGPRAPHARRLFRPRSLRNVIGVHARVHRPFAGPRRAYTAGVRRGIRSVPSDIIGSTTVSSTANNIYTIMYSYIICTVRYLWKPISRRPPVCRVYAEQSDAVSRPSGDPPKLNFSET